MLSDFVKKMSVICYVSAERPQNNNKGRGGEGDSPSPQEPTWVHEIFQGILTSETRCLNCETVSNCSKC